jgi:cyclase
MSINPLAKRITPCLDIKEGRIVKGVNFVGLSDAGGSDRSCAPLQRRRRGRALLFGLTASHERRGLIADMLREVAKEVFIPLTVGGGISSVDDIYALL